MHDVLQPIAELLHEHRFRGDLNFLQNSSKFLTDQLECLFFHFFGNVTPVEPVYGQIIVMSSALNVSNITKFTNGQTDVLKYLSKKSDVFLSL
jgi:hypothetical protein